MKKSAQRWKGSKAMLAFGTYSEAVETLMTYLAFVYIPGPPPNAVRTIWKGDPARFSASGVPFPFPAIVIPRPTAGGASMYHESRLPGTFDFEVQALYPTVGSAADSDGRLEAQENADLALSAYLSALWAAGGDADGQVSDIAHVGSSSGDFDRFGNARVDANTRSILWISQATLRVSL